MRRWLQFALTLMIAISLTAAPCRNCRPLPADAAPAAHDCCRKQTPSKDCGTEKSQSCKWQPSDKAAPESKVQMGVLFAVEPLGDIAEVERRPEVELIQHVPATRGSPPLLFLLHSALLI